MRLWGGPPAPRRYDQTTNCQREGREEKILIAVPYEAGRGKVNRNSVVLSSPLAAPSLPLPLPPPCRGFVFTFIYLSIFYLYFLHFKKRERERKKYLLQYILFLRTNPKRIIFLNLFLFNTDEIGCWLITISNDIIKIDTNLSTLFLN